MTYENTQTTSQTTSQTTLQKTLQIQPQEKIFAIDQLTSQGVDMMVTLYQFDGKFSSADISFSYKNHGEIGKEHAVQNPQLFKGISDSPYKEAIIADGILDIFNYESPLLFNLEGGNLSQGVAQSHIAQLLGTFLYGAAGVNTDFTSTTLQYVQAVRTATNKAIASGLHFDEKVGVKSPTYFSLLQIFLDQTSIEDSIYEMMQILAYRKGTQPPSDLVLFPLSVRKTASLEDRIPQRAMAMGE